MKEIDPNYTIPKKPNDNEIQETQTIDQTSVMNYYYNLPQNVLGFFGENETNSLTNNPLATNDVIANNLKRPHEDNMTIIHGPICKE